MDGPLKIKETMTGIKAAQNQVQLLAIPPIAKCIQKEFSSLCSAMDAAALPILNFTIENQYNGKPKRLQIIILECP